MGVDLKMSELYHHGILGQRWGKKNGPPYPLDASDHSASERKAGWRKSLNASSQRKGKNNSTSYRVNTGKGLTDRQKKAILIGAGVVATGLVAYGVYRSGVLDKDLIQEGESARASFDHADLNISNDAIRRMRDITIKDISSHLEAPSAMSQEAVNKIEALKNQLPKQSDNDSLDWLVNNAEQRVDLASKAKEDLQKAGFSLKKKDTSWPDDAQIAGKFYSLRNTGDTSQDNNCTRASVSYVLRRMGFDVEPKRIESSNPSGADVGSILRVFKGSIPERVRVSSGSSIEARASLMKEIKSNYSDSSKAFGIVLIPRGPKGVAGHAMAFEKNGDSVVILDPQSGGIGKVPKIFDHIANGYFSDNIILVRADDCGVDPDLVKDYVVNKIRA